MENSKFLAMVRHACTLKRDEATARLEYKQHVLNAYANPPWEPISLVQTANALGISYQHLFRIVREAMSEFEPEQGETDEFIRLAIEARNRQKKLYREWILAVVETVKAARDEGIAMRHVARELGISAVHIYRILKEVGNAER